MKNLIFINGAMGVGKTAVCTELNRILDRSVMLDGDWCWAMDPFQVTDATKAMVVDNIAHLLRNFLCCDALDNVVFCWVMHEQTIVDGLLARLDGLDFHFFIYTLTCSPDILTARLGRDIETGLRQADVIGRSLARLPLYDAMDTVKIDADRAPPGAIAAEIHRLTGAKP